MDGSGWGVLLSALTLAVAVPTLTLMVVQEFRARERADVEWEVARIGEGEFRVTNVGADIARQVRVEMWSADELKTANTRKLKSRGELVLRLPSRAARGPDPVDHLPEPYPRPKGIPVPQSTLDNIDRLRRDAEEAQVSVKIVWRTGWGTWRSHSTHTG